jgi:hypothetical protein
MPPETAHVGNLSGVVLLHSPDTFNYGPAIREFEPGSPTLEKIDAFTRAEQYTADLAARHGAQIISIAEGQDAPEGENVYWQNRSYFAAHATMQEILNANRSIIPDMPRYAPSEAQAAYQELQAGNSLVIAYLPLDGGHVKYHITEPTQLDRFLAFLEKAGNKVNPNNFEIRRFIETPSDHYTSYRVVVDPNGEMLASALYYSSHSKSGAERIIRYDRFSDSRPGGIPRLIKTHLEVPESPFYIGGGDVRSNSACGGKTIPLSGSNPRPITRAEQRILEAHEIDPTHAGAPQRLVEVAQSIGRLVGRHVHLLTAVDFVNDYYSETNFSPSGGAYAACEMRGGGTRYERYIAMRRRVLANLASFHAMRA